MGAAVAPLAATNLEPLHGPIRFYTLPAVFASAARFPGYRCGAGISVLVPCRGWAVGSTWEGPPRFPAAPGPRVGGSAARGYGKVFDFCTTAGVPRSRLCLDRSEKYYRQK